MSRGTVGSWLDWRLPRDEEETVETTLEVGSANRIAHVDYLRGDLLQQRNSNLRVALLAAAEANRDEYLVPVGEKAVGLPDPDGKVTAVDLRRKADLNRSNLVRTGSSILAPSQLALQVQPSSNFVYYFTYPDI